MNDTPLTREALLAGIENLSLRISSFSVLRRVWKILDREFEAERESYTDLPVDASMSAWRFTTTPDTSTALTSSP